MNICVLFLITSCYIVSLFLKSLNVFNLLRLSSTTMLFEQTTKTIFRVSSGRHILSTSLLYELAIKRARAANLTTVQAILPHCNAAEDFTVETGPVAVMNRTTPPPTRQNSRLLRLNEHQQSSGQELEQEQH